jgi:hypothetical protein
LRSLRSYTYPSTNLTENPVSLPVFEEFEELQMDMCNSSNSSKTGSETGSSVRLVDGYV